MRMSSRVKKIAGMVATFVLVGVLASCTSGGAVDEQAVETGDEVAVETSDEPSVGIANPWSDVASAAEAGEGAFADAFEVPETLPIGDIAWMAPTFRFMDGIAEADYQGGAVEAWVRKGKGVSGEMLHGVYEDPAQPWVAWTVEADDVSVSCLGYEDEVANVLEWSGDGYNYSVFVIGLGGENYGVREADVAALVASIG